MREIKFRAFDGMVWIYSSAVDYRGEFEQWCIYDFEKEEWLYCSKPEQYTGLKDKNGVEIFEGDIISENEEYAVCCWIDEVASFAFVPIEVFPAKDFITIHETYGLDTFFRNDVPEQFVKVIGNIYEHPELLGDSQ